MVTIPERVVPHGVGSGQDNERPIHRVWVDAFQMGAARLPILNTLVFLRRLETLPRLPGRSEPKSSPAAGVSVSWFEATQYCDWLSVAWAKPAVYPARQSGSAPPAAELKANFSRGAIRPPQTRAEYAARWKIRHRTGRYAACQSLWAIRHQRERTRVVQRLVPPGILFADSPERNPQGPETGERKGFTRRVLAASCKDQPMRGAGSSIPPAFQYADYGFRVAASL